MVGHLIGWHFELPPLVNNATAAQQLVIPTWQLVSTTTAALALPSASLQQTAALVLDIDGDGWQDFAIASRRPPGPALVWYQRRSDGWEKYLIDQGPLSIEAGGAYFDIDGDGDLDIVMGGDGRARQVWWWENPAPNFAPDQGWQRRIIKDSGPGKHHDQIFGDFTGDGRIDLVFWNQHASALLLGTIPDDPHQTDPWPLQSIYHYEGIEHEGLAAADMDVDGVMDIVGGGRWFRHQNGKFEVHVIDDHQRFSRAAAGQLIAGGSPEVVFVCGDCIGPLRWYEWDGAAWRAHDLLDVPVDHGHSLQLADINDDGALDIFVAEMRLDEKNPDAATRILLGNGAGTFLETRVVTGNGYHESKVADLDGDGDLDILGKPYTWETPRLDIWLNQQQCTPATGSVTGPLANWQRHVIDASRPWRAFFIDAADLDGDGDADIVTGGWWYENPGIVAGTWSRHSFGDRLANMALLHDFDGDGAIDILGARAQQPKQTTVLHGHKMTVRAILPT
ncbi:MAG: VCBS repeat-containing protein [Caldilineaceae bacterium]